MALFEPTNISPDMKYSTANGTVDVSEGLDIAWQVNGNSMTPMTGYRITIRENSPSDTLVYMTPMERLAEPFVGADALGNPIRYQVHLPKENTQTGHYFGYSSKTITNVAVDFDLFVGTFSEYNLYQFVYVGSGWRIAGGIETSLAPYGITYSGTPASQDVISVVIGAPMVNGREYKLEISQMWQYGDSGGAAIIAQKSPSVFISRAKPVLTLGDIPAPLPKRAYTFTATYFQAQYDALTWVRWRVARTEDLDNPLYDSGRIYGAGALETSYDGFFTGNSYSVRCDGETINGVTVDTGWTTFFVEYPMPSVPGALFCDCVPMRSAVRLKVMLRSIPGHASTYHFADKQLVLEEQQSEASWGTLALMPTISAAPWSLVYKTTKILSGWLGGEVFIINNSSEQSIFLAKQNDTIQLVYGPVLGGTVAETVACSNTDSVALYLTPSKDAAHPSDSYVRFVLCVETESGTVTQKQGYLPIAQPTLGGVRLNGQQSCAYIQSFDGAEETAVDRWLSAGNSLSSYVAARDGSTVMLTQWHLGTDTLNAGFVSDSTITTISLYREKNNSLTKAAVVTPASYNVVYDYGIGSRQGPFSYYAFLEADDGAWYNPVVSGKINPCWWDWTLLSCVEEADNVYRVEQEFHFGKNLSTGAISNNNAPSLWNNFTRYPTIQRAPQNYQSGSLTSLIGVIADGEYTDTIAARDAIWALSTTQNTLFLKNRKGDVLMVAISGAITMQTGDNTPQQTQTATIPWTEIGSADGVQIYSLS